MSTWERQCSAHDHASDSALQPTPTRAAWVPGAVHFLVRVGAAERQAVRRIRMSFGRR
jgi:hypothetical protein